MDVPPGRSRMQVVQVGIERRRGQNWAAKHHHYTYIAYGWRAPGNSSGRSCSVLINVHLECVIDHGEGMRVATAETWWLKGREDTKHIPKARQACNMPRAVPTQKRISRQPVIPSSVCKLYQGGGGGGGGIRNVFHEWTLAFILKIDSWSVPVHSHTCPSSACCPGRWVIISWVMRGAVNGWHADRVHAEMLTYQTMYF